MSEEIAIRPPTPAALPPAVMSDDEMNRLWRMARALFQSGMFKDLEAAEQAYAKILIGHDLGLSPTQSMMGLHIIEGKPEVAAVMMANFITQRGYTYEVVEHDETICHLRFYRGEPDTGRLLGDATFTIAQAERAGLTKPSRNGKPSNFVKYPEDMLWWRALSRGVKRYCPDALHGLPVYVPGEIERPGDGPALTAGSDAPPAGLALGPEVEAVIARATEVGHAGLGEGARASIEMTLDGRPPEAVHAWVAQATAELDAFEPQAGETEAVASEGEPVDAEVVPASDEVAKSEQDPQGAIMEHGRRVAAAHSSPDPDGGFDDGPDGQHTQSETGNAQERYERDAAWAAKVDRLLHRQADLEIGLDQEPAHRHGEINAELDAVDGQLRTEGVPAGWHPVSAGQVPLGI